jgi:hypothetical protein
MKICPGNNNWYAFGLNLIVEIIELLCGQTLKAKNL